MQALKKFTTHFAPENEILFFPQDSTIRSKLGNSFSDWRNRVHGAHADAPQLCERFDGTQS